MLNNCFPEPNQKSSQKDYGLLSEAGLSLLTKWHFKKRIATFLMNHSKNEDKFVNYILVSQTFGYN
jgi:hypothetical protein